MSIFLELISSKDKQEELEIAIKNINHGENNRKVHLVDSKLFPAIPGAPFSYWVTDKVRKIFSENDKLESENVTAKQGLSTADDFRFVRLWWELNENSEGFFPFAKGGAFAELYSDIYLSVYWGDDGEQIKAWANTLYNNSHWSRIIKNTKFYFKEGITWSRRTQNLSTKILPRGCIFADKGPAIFSADSDEVELVVLCTLMNSNAFRELVATRLNAADTTARSFEVGIIQNTPLPFISTENKNKLYEIGSNIIEIKKKLDSVVENSRQFHMPALMQKLHGYRDREGLEQKLIKLVEDKEKLCAELYSFEPEELISSRDFDCISEVRGLKEDLDLEAYYYSWAIGVAFNRYELTELDNGQIDYNAEDIFESLKNESKAMVGSSGKKNNINCISSEKLASNLVKIAKSCDINCDFEVSAWLKSKFFEQHLKQFSKGRRQAPIYWPLESKNGFCKVWVYYHQLNSQTLLSCINEYVQPQIIEVVDELSLLRTEINRSPAIEKTIDKLVELKQDIEEFKEQLVSLSKLWQPNLNDGVQITAAPLWRLFQHKPWQKKLKQTWEKLEDGDYDWAHLAYTTWPERVLKKCHVDRSIAIAHDVESDLWHEVEVIKGRKKEPVWEWQPKPLSPAELNDYVREKIATDERLALYRSNAKNSGVKS